MKQSVLFFQRISLLLSVLLLLAGCSSSDSEEQEKGGESQPEIRFNADVWQVMERTRATTFDNATALQTEGTFTCYAYNSATTTVYESVNGATATWSSTYWSIAGRPTWPESGDLDFFAYMPANMTNTHCTFDSEPYDEESNRDGYSENMPRIVCTTLPVNITVGEDNTTELIYAYVSNQNKDNAGSGVELTFKRPFARVYFKKADGLTGVTINSVTIADIKNNGLCTFNGTATTWTPSGDPTNLVVTGSPATGDTPYLVLPQTLGSKTITVNASWTSWSPTTKDVSTTLDLGSWVAGNSYTYTFTLNGDVLIVDTEKFTEQW